MVYGVEIFIVMKDIWNDKNKDILTNMMWMAEAVIDSAINQAKSHLEKKQKVIS
jgi:hypothetical protein